MAGKYVNIDDLNIDLIDTVNPFQKAFEILSKAVTQRVCDSCRTLSTGRVLAIEEPEAHPLAKDPRVRSAQR